MAAADVAPTLPGVEDEPMLPRQRRRRPTRPTGGSEGEGLDRLEAARPRSPTDVWSLQYTGEGRRDPLRAEETIRSIIPGVLRDLASASALIFASPPAAAVARNSRLPFSAPRRCKPTRYIVALGFASRQTKS